MRRAWCMLVIVLAARALASADPTPQLESVQSGEVSAAAVRVAGSLGAPVSAPAVPAVAAAADAWDADVSDVDKLRTPDSPAFVILGASPTEIQHPTTPRALIVALGGLVGGGDLSVPREVAIEVAPYWLLRHPDLTIQDYRDEALLRPLRTLSLSVGTTRTDRTEGTGATAMTHTDADIGIGLRTMLLQAGPEDACTRAAKEFAALVNGPMLFTKLEQQELANAGAFGSNDWKKKRTEIEARKAQVKVAADAELKKLRNEKCVALAASPTGFSLDLAGAIHVHAVDARLTRAATSLADYALWTNLSYDTSRFSAIAVARLAGHKNEMSTERLFDAGLRGIYKQKTYAVSAEALVRHRFTDAPDPTTYKVDLAVEYKMTDDTWLSVTFGKGFGFAAGDIGSWFSLANLQWSFGKPKL